MAGFLGVTRDGVTIGAVTRILTVRPDCRVPRRHPRWRDYWCRDPDSDCAPRLQGSSASPAMAWLLVP